MNISMKVEGMAELQEKLASLKKGTARRAVVRWSNWIGITAQAEMRQQLGTRFTFRGTEESFKKAILFQAAAFSGERSVKSELKVGGAGESESATRRFGEMLARHENQEARTERSQIYFDGRGKPFQAGFFLPAKGLRTRTANPPRSLYPSSIGATIRVQKTKGGEKVILANGTKKGGKKRGTGVSYFATPKGIFRRRHTSFGGRVDVEAVWWFRNTVKTPARLGLWQTAETVFKTRGAELGMQAVQETIYREML